MQSLKNLIEELVMVQLSDNIKREGKKKKNYSMEKIKFH